MGFPIIALVVGSHATLLAATGLGPKNGASATAGGGKTRAQNPKLFLNHHALPSGARCRRAPPGAKLRLGRRPETAPSVK
jgi:hypothetical protein